MTMYRLTLTGGRTYDIEAATMDDNGLKLTFLGEDGRIVMRFADSDIESCSIVDEPEIAAGETYGLGGVRLFDADGQVVAVARSAQAARNL